MDGICEGPSDAPIPFDIVIPYHEKDADILPYCVESIRRFLRGVRDIYVISRAPPDVEGVTWVAEDRFPFGLAEVEAVVGRERRGWYYQQLLKYYAHIVIPGLDTYLVPDSDVVFLRPVEFFRGETLLFDHGGIYNEPYFSHMKRLLPKAFPTFLEGVGTTDCMMYRCDILADLFRRVEEEWGLPMWKAMLAAVDPSTYTGSGMSEQEIYFQFARQHYPRAYEIRMLAKYMGLKMCELSRTDADFLSFHAWLRD